MSSTPDPTASVDRPEPEDYATGGGRPSARRRHSRRLLLALVPVAVLALAVAVAAWTGLLATLLGRAASPPAYREVTYSLNQPVLGRDFVIAPSDATPERIEWLVATIAAEDNSPLLRINVFTSEAAAQRRRELIAQNIYAHDENEPDPPQWRDVDRDWVGIYTRDPFSAVHQLSICLNDPTHDHCTVRRYPTAAQ